MALTENGVSTTEGRGQFRFEWYNSISGRALLQWDYRDSKGVLHSGIDKGIEAARKAVERASGEKIIL